MTTFTFARRGIFWFFYLLDFFGIAVIMPYFIGIDSGTQSTKTVVVQASTGNVVGSASKSYGFIKNLPPGYKEQHPQVWLDAARNTIRAALHEAKINPSAVLAMGVSGQQHGFVPLDSHGKVIRPAKLWCDTSTDIECQHLLKKIGGLRRSLQLTGNSIPAGFTASKILWLKQNEPKNYARLRTVLLPHDYLNFWLTGVKSMEYGDASGTGLLDVKIRKWQSEVIKAIGLELASKLPPVRPSHEPIGTLLLSTAKALGLPPTVLVSAGGGDNMMGAIGTGNTKPGIVTASFGTSGTIYAYSSKPIVDPKGEVAAFCDSTGAWLPLVCTMNLTVATEMVRNCFGWSHEQFSRRASKAPPGSGSLLLIPYLEGERTPNVPEGTGVFFGVTPHTFDPAIFARASMEGVTLGMNYGLNRLRQLGIQPQQIRVTGGGSRSSLWRQIMADIFQCEVIGMKTQEGAAYGAALQAWWCYENSRGKPLSISNLTDHCVQTNPRTIAYPRPKEGKLYQELQALQDRAGGDMNKLFQLHRAIHDSQAARLS